MRRSTVKLSALLSYLATASAFTFNVSQPTQCGEMLVKWYVWQSVFSSGL